MPLGWTQLKAILLGLAAGGLVAATLEAGARVAYALRGDAGRGETGWFVYAPDLGWTRKPGFKGLEGGYERAFDEQGFFTADSAQLRDHHDARVLAFGDSNTFGVGAPTDASFVEVADQLLPGVSVINLGVVGGSSYQGRVAVSKFLPALRPDLVVVSYNFNDRRYVRHREEADHAEQFERIWQASTGQAAGLQSMLQTSYASRGLQSLLTSAGVLSSAPELDLSTTTPRVDEEGYRRNLEHIIATAGHQGVPLVFIALKDNPFEVEALDRGLERLAHNDISGAITALETAIGRHNAFSDLARLHLAEAYNRAGRATDAARALRTSYQRSLAGGGPIRRDVDYNRIMREVAAAHAVPVVEGGRAIDERPGDYIDFCHFNAAGHRRIGELLAERISSTLGARTPVPSTPPEPQAIYEQNDLSSN